MKILKNMVTKDAIRLYIIVLTLMFSFTNNTFALSGKMLFDVFAYGAKGNGMSMDTKAIQSAIDACYKEGGGKVYLHSGTFLSGTIYLKSHVVLYIEAGAKLLGSERQVDYPVKPSRHLSYHGEYITNRMLIYAEDAENISIDGSGIIDGQGDNFENLNSLEALIERPKIIHFRGCKNVAVRNISLQNSASWVQSYQQCENLIIDGITVLSRENKDINKPRFEDAPGRNTDGLDILDCHNVRITNSFISSGDDGICLKSISRKEACRNIVITNCIVSTNASGIKIGTESAGGFEDIIISNCTVYDTRLGGIDIMSVDGARIERILVSDITLRNLRGTGIFVRLGDRGRTYRKDEKPEIGSIKNVLFQNIYGTGIERYGCSITGIPEKSVENIVLNNVNLTFDGGSEPFLFQGESGKYVPELTIDNVPEVPKKHPRGDMFGKLPAYGFYIRHVKNIEFDGLILDTQKEDVRSAIVAEDVVGLSVLDFSAKVLSGIQPVVLKNVSQSAISENKP